MSDSASSAGARLPRWRPLLEAAIAALALVALWLVAQTPQWRQLEFKTFDLYTALGARGSAAPIVIVAIDEPSFRELGLQWPFPRHVHADLIDRVASDGARVIAFDVLFSEPTDTENDQRLATAIGRASNVVLAKTREVSETTASREWSVVEPLPSLRAAGARVGDVGVDPDADYVVRLVPGPADSFPRVIVRAAQGMSGQATEESGTKLIRYASQGSFPTVHYYQALQSGLLPPGFFRNKIVLVGLDVRSSPEPSRSDLYNSPFLDVAGRLMPGVEIHANIAANLLDGRTLEPAPAIVDAALAVALALAVGVVGWRRGPARAATVLIGTSALALLASYGLFTRSAIWLSPLLPIAAGTWIIIVDTAVGFLIQRRRALETKRAFAQYVPAEIVNRLIERPELLELGGEERELTLLFSDLANFTTFSEQLAPRTVVAILGQYFDLMSAVIYRHGGTVDKYIGDGIMAFWGAPLADEHHAERALRAAVEMQTVFAQVSNRLVAQRLPGMTMRIGIHTGNVVVGNVGSKSRFAYTAIGDAVNLASRLEGANKAYGTAILLSDATARQLGAGAKLRPVDWVIVKGRTDAVMVFTPCDDEELVKLSAAALDAYQRQDWEASLRACREILVAHPGDGVALAFSAHVGALRSGDATAA